MSNQPKITRNEFTLLLNFYRWGQPRYYAKVELIVTSLTTEPLLTLLPDPWHPLYPSRAELKSVFAEYRSAMIAAEKGLKTAITERDVKRTDLQRVLGGVASYLESVARHANDLSLLERTGFDRQRPIVRHPIAGTLPAPKIQVRQGPLSGTLRADTKRLERGGCFELQIATGGDPGEASFTTVIVCTRARGLLVRGLSPGQLYHLRLRFLGRHGATDWSQVISRHAN